MKIERQHSWKKLLAQMILLVIPTALLALVMLKQANESLGILQNGYLLQTAFLSLGVAASLLVYSFRFRFLTTVVLLVLLQSFIYYLTSKIVVGEFDTVLAQQQVKIFNTLFFIGWLVGYGFARSRYVTILWSLLLLVVQVIVISKTDDIRTALLIRAFAPTLVYSVYIIYTSELLRNFNEEEKSFAFIIGRRIFGFAAIIALLLLGVFTFFKQDFQGIEKEYANQQGKDGGYDKNKSNSESMTKENKDGTLQNKNQTKLTGSLSKGKRLVFVAKLDNFFADGQTPNPLYFTSCFYSKFDTTIQAFEIDSLMPKNDLFKPDPSKIPLYFNKTDSSVIKNTMATLQRKVVSADVYKVLLSPDEFIAPSTAFYCQPIPVEKEYQDQYKSAYRAKMWVSDLNSAYFIYNPAGNQMLEAFQEARFNALRQVTNFNSVEKKFNDYYTFMPKDEEYKKITALAQDITKNAKTPVDKIIAIRDYFLSKDEYDVPLFTYNDNPGIPGIPSANKLSYFLFENRKGYCAYYAGATLFMLRALGIPSRLAAGFLTIDRNSKNPGWYWFYEDQAHAWVQVYFPGYGWIDFDTTVPDRNVREADQADGTPPTDMQQAWMVAEGNCTKTDTVAKTAEMTVSKLIYHEKFFEVEKKITIQLDAKVASITTDTGKTSFNNLKPGMHITAVSFAEALKNILPTEKDDAVSLKAKLPALIPTDEIRIMEKIEDKKEDKKAALTKGKDINWWTVLWTSVGVITGLILLAFLSPYFIWVYLHNKAKGNHPPQAKAYAINRAAMYYLNQLGYSRSNYSPEEYGQLIDGKFATQLHRFNNIYQKIKYSKQPFTASENAYVSSFYLPFINAVRKQVKWKNRFIAFLNINRTIQYFKTIKR